MGADAEDRPGMLRSSLNRRKAIGLGSGLAASLALSGQFGRVAAQSATPAATPASTAPVSPIAASGGLDQQEIRILIFSGPEADAHTRLAAEFTDYTKGKVKVTIDQGGRDTTYDALWLAALQAGTDAYDVVHADAPKFLLAGPAGYFAPLEPFMADPNLFDANAYNLKDFPDSVLGLFQYKGQQFLLPQEVSTLMFYYRKDLLAKYNIPEPSIQGYTWDDLKAHAITIQAALAKEGLTDTYALTFGVKPSFHAAVNVVQPGWSLGQELFDAKFNPLFDQPKWAQATTMMTEYLFKDKTVSPGIVGYEYPEVLTAYQQGKAVMALEWNAAATTIIDPKSSPITAATTGFSAYPYDATAGPTQPRVIPSVHAIGVSKFSKKQQAAFAYVAWFTSQAVARDYVVHGGGSSGRSSLLTDPEILKTDPFYTAVQEGFKVYHPLPQIVQWNYIFTNIIGSDLASVWTNQLSIPDGMSKIQSELKSYLQDQGVL